MKSTFVVLLKRSSDREKIFKKLLNKIKLLPDYLESFSKNSETVEWVLAEWLYFLRPKVIIDHIIDIRNNIAHAAIIDVTLTDDVINQYVKNCRSR